MTPRAMGNHEAASTESQRPCAEGASPVTWSTSHSAQEALLEVRGAHSPGQPVAWVPLVSSTLFSFPPEAAPPFRLSMPAWLWSSTNQSNLETFYFTAYKLFWPQVLGTVALVSTL